MLRNLLDRYVKHNDIVIDGEIYMRRYFPMKHTKRHGALRIHHIRLPDPGRELHDHPFGFLSLIVHGNYVEETPGRTKHRRRFSIALRRATAVHRISQLNGDVWTVVLTTRIKRQWGFEVDGVWMDHNTYIETKSNPSVTYTSPMVKGS